MVNRAPDVPYAATDHPVAYPSQSTGLPKTARMLTLIVALGGAISCNREPSDTHPSVMEPTVESSAPIPGEGYEDRIAEALVRSKAESRQLTAMDTCMAWYGDAANEDKCEKVVALDRELSQRQRAARIRATLDEE